MKLYSVTWTKEVDVVLATEDDVDDADVCKLAERMAYTNDVDGMYNGCGWDATVRAVKTTSQNVIAFRPDCALMDGRIEDIRDCGQRFVPNVVKYKMEALDALGPYAPHVASKYDEDTDTWSHEVSVGCAAVLEPEAFEVYQRVLDRLVTSRLDIAPTATSVVWLGRRLV